MRVRVLNQNSVGPVRNERPLPPGTGILIAGGVSVVLWAIIIGIAALF